MTSNPKNQASATRGTTTHLEAGTYDVIRTRLQQQSSQLQERLIQLDRERQIVFGGQEKQLLSNNRIHTKNNCIASDLAAVGTHCILGYNVHIGLRQEIQLEDVFGIYQFDGKHFHESGLDLLQDEKFITDFSNLYRYYKDASFARFIRQDAYLFMVFQVSDVTDDIKAFKWLLEEGQLSYIDARSEKEIRRPAQHEFKWTAVGRDAHRKGKHPHISILDRVFVEAIGGDITIKIEDNTDDGLGIYREVVEYKDQTLDDGEYSFAQLGHLIALCIQPYQEAARYYIFNEKNNKVERIDALRDAGILLPEGHGVIFPDAYYLKTGTFKRFELEVGTKRFVRCISAPNGEDFLYVFYNQEEGTYVLLHYNLIKQEVDTPIICHGYACMQDGTLAYFRSETEAVRHHLIQVWSTPFGKEVAKEATDTDHFLYKVGNKELVRAMADAQELQALLSKDDDAYAGLYEDIDQQCTRMLDTYHWLAAEAGQNISEPIGLIRETALAAIDAFEKKKQAEHAAQDAFQSVEKEARNLFKDIEHQSEKGLEVFVKQMASLRALRGKTIALKKQRYANERAIESLEDQIVNITREVGELCVSFLLEEDSLQSYHERINGLSTAAVEAKTMSALRELLDTTSEIEDALQLLMEMVQNLKIEEVSQATAITERLTALFARLNQEKSQLEGRRKELYRLESGAAFKAAIQLLEQATASLLEAADNPEKCDEGLSKAMVQLEELDGQFAESDEFIEQLGEKRATVYSAFDTRKRQLLEASNKKAATIERAAGRLLENIRKRSQQIKEEAEIHHFFAADLLVDKVRDIILQLKNMRELNKASAINAKLEGVKEEALRQWQDRTELFIDGENVIRLGKHAFEVNVQPLELTIIPQDGQLYFHLTGTNFYELIEDDVMNDSKRFWNQTLPSETKDIDRASFLAYQLLQEGIGRELLPLLIKENAAVPHPDLQKQVAKIAASRLEEGYTRGVHDVDAAQILQHLLVMEEKLGLLRYPPEVRAKALFSWHRLMQETTRQQLNTQIKAAGQLLKVFPDSQDFDFLFEDLAKAME